MPQKVLQTPEELEARVRRYYARYGSEIEQVKNLVEIKLRQMALAYTLNNNLSPEAVRVSARVKTVESAIRKLARDGWQEFYLPTERINDIIGARIVCWFIKDCQEILDCIQASTHFKVRKDIPFPVKDYIAQPQVAGYRAIHVFADVVYDSVQRGPDGKAIVVPEDMTFEVQIRSSLQDAWADVTHEFFYKARDIGVESKELELSLRSLAKLLSDHDALFTELRQFYQRLADEKMKNNTRSGLRA